jgi:hypothetical protein
MVTGERPMTLEEKITALENEIADYKREYDAAIAEGDKQMQLSLLNTITAARNDLTELRLERRQQTIQSK